MKLAILLIVFQLTIHATALTFTSPSLDTTWNSSGPHTLVWFTDSSDYLSGSMQIHFVNSFFSESILVVDQADIGLGTYTFDTVLPTGSDWTVLADVYAIGDITDSTILSSGQSDEFNIVPGGPSPQISVTVINLSTLSTIGGTIFTAFTPDGDEATVTEISFTVTNDAFPFTTGNSNVTPTSTFPSGIITSSTISPSTGPHNTGNGLSPGATIGIAIGAILVIIFLVLMAGLYFMTRRRRSANKKIDDQGIQLSGRLASNETLEKDFDAPTLKYGDDDAEVEILSGRINTAFESHNLRRSIVK